MEYRRRKQGFRKDYCPSCGKRSRYIEVDIIGNDGFDLCQSCGYSATLTSRGYAPPGKLANQL